MRIIDFHTHCFPDSIAPRAMAVLSEKALLPNMHDGTAAGLDRFEREGGCDGYVALSIATNPKQTASVNRFAASLIDEKNLVFAFGSVHPGNEDYKEQLAFVKDSGLRGIKLHPEYQSFHPNDEGMLPIYEEIFRLGLPLIFHAGEDEGYRPPWHSEPFKIAEAARRYPEAVIIAAHMGGYKMWREAGAHLSPLDNVYIDVSFSAGLMPREEFEEAMSVWPVERVLFGTDSPWYNVKDSVAAVMALPLSDEEKSLIFSENALRVLLNKR